MKLPCIRARRCPLPGFHLVVLALPVISLACIAAPLEAATFSAREMHDWPTRSFADETEYRLVERGGRDVLEARSRGKAPPKYRVKSDYFMVSVTRCAMASNRASRSRAIAPSSSPASST